MASDEPLRQGLEGIPVAETRLSRIDGENKPDRRLKTNVEFYTALLLDGVGIPKDLVTATFAVSRVGGSMAHALEQLDDNRLIRPTARYIGDAGRS